MNRKVFLETPRLMLRQWENTDYFPYAALNQDTDVMEFFPSIKTEQESAKQIERFVKQIEQLGFGFFAVERKDNQQFIGFTGLANPGFQSFFTPCIEVGWRLSKDNWNQGFATEAAIACLEFGFEALSLTEIFSFTSVHNKRSEKVMIKAGMVNAGYFDHPVLEEGHFLQQHVLYKISR